MSTVTIVDHIPEILEQLDTACAKIVRDTAEDVVSVYTANAPEATGHMASSAYLVTHSESTYGQGIVGEGALLDEVERPSSETEAVAAVAADYAAYVEYGTVSDPARPAFTPAVDAVAPRFSARLEALESHIKVKE